jgi:hypothetical protein
VAAPGGVVTPGAGNRSTLHQPAYLRKAPSASLDEW